MLLKLCKFEGKPELNVSFQKSSSIAFADNCKYVSTSKFYMLPSDNTPSHKKSVISPPISHVSTLSKLFSSTMPSQNFQCTNAPSKSVTCSTIKNKRLHSDVYVIRNYTVNVISNSMIAPVSPRPSSSSDYFIPLCHRDSLKRSKRMTGKIVSFCQDSNNVSNYHFRGGEKNNMLLKG